MQIAFGKVVKAFYDTKDDTKDITERQRLIYNLLAAVDTKDDTKDDTNRLKLLLRDYPKDKFYK